MYFCIKFYQVINNFYKLNPDNRTNAFGRAKQESLGFIFYFNGYIF